MHKRVSVAEGKREFTQLLKKAKEKGIPILVFNERRMSLLASSFHPQSSRGTSVCARISRPCTSSKSSPALGPMPLSWSESSARS